VPSFFFGIHCEGGLQPVRWGGESGPLPVFFLQVWNLKGLAENGLRKAAAVERMDPPPGGVRKL